MFKIVRSFKYNIITSVSDNFLFSKMLEHGHFHVEGSQCSIHRW